jgi:hypothetical protein
MAGVAAGTLINVYPGLSDYIGPGPPKLYGSADIVQLG